MSNYEREFDLQRNTEKDKEHCFSCQIISGERRKLENHIFETAHFDAHQDYQIPIPGMVIVAAKEHKRGLEEFSTEQLHEYIELMANCSKGIKESLGASANELPRSRADAVSDEIFKKGELSTGDLCIGFSLIFDILLYNFFIAEL